MKPRKFFIRPVNARFGVFSGGSLQTKARTFAQAAAWVTAQECEDRTDRLWKVVDYLNDRADRPKVVAQPTDQLSLL